MVTDRVCDTIACACDSLLLWTHICSGPVTTNRWPVTVWWWWNTFESLSFASMVMQGTHTTSERYTSANAIRVAYGCMGSLDMGMSSARCRLRHAAR